MTVPDPAGSKPERSIDGFLDRRVTLIQPRSGHRAGLDAALLQAIVPGDAEGSVVDLGTGVGTIAFCVAARAPRASLWGIERDSELVSCARLALQLTENAGFRGRVRIVQGDITGSGEADLPMRSAEWVLMNPPFDTERRVRHSPDPLRRGAHVGGADTLDAWVRAAAAILKPGGMLGLIHRAAQLGPVLDAIRPRFGEIRVVPVQPSTARPASRIVVRARLGSQAGLQLMPPLVLHDQHGAWTVAADAILRGRAELAL